MTQVSAESAARPTIGDILLAHGFVSSDDLAAALEEQQRTEQPLGQILVTRGSITRLELASALAEQWSMAPEPRPSAGAALARPGMPSVIDDDTYAARVQSAVSDLARRVGAAEPLLAEVERRAAESVSPHELDARLAEVQSRIELSRGRLEALESDLSTVAQQLEEMTDGVERAFADMQAGTGELAERLAAVAASVAGQPWAAELSVVQDAVESLAARAQADPGLTDRIDELAPQVAAGLEAIDVFRVELQELAGRPVGDPGLAERVDERVGELERRLEESRELVAAGLRIELVALEGRIAAAADGGALQELEARVVELSSRPEADPGLSTRLAELVAEVAGLRDAPAPAAVPDPQVDALREQVERLAAEVEGLAAIARAGEQGPELEELRGALDELGRRRSGDEETRRLLDDLSARVSELAERPAVDAVLAARVDDLAADLGAVARADEVQRLRGALEEVVDRATPVPPGLEERIVDLALEQVRGELHAWVAEHGGAIDALRTQLAAIEAAPQPGVSDEAAQPWRVEHEQLSVRLDELASRIEHDIVPPEPDQTSARSEATTERELERQRLAIERLGLHLGEHERALAEMMRSRGVVERLDALAARVEELAGATAGAPAAASSGGEGSPELHAELRALARRLEESLESAQADRQKLLTQLDRMASSIDWRLQRLEAGTAETTATR